MIALTSRLNERDETIIQLQEELDAFDQITMEAENNVLQKQARIEQLESFIQNECGMQVPENLYENAQEIQMLNMGRSNQSPHTMDYSDPEFGSQN